MTNKKNLPPKYQVWVDARKRFRLTDAQVQMARELGMNPKGFGKLANHKQERWKLPLPAFIEQRYFRRFHKERPDNVRSIEQMVQNENRKKEERKQRKLAKREAEGADSEATKPPAVESCTPNSVASDVTTMS